MHHHTAFGLKIDAPFALPELTSRPAGSPSDVAIRFGELGPPDPAGVRPPTSDREYIYVGDIGAFLIRDAREIVIDPLPGVDESSIRQILLGIIMTILLRQRGWIVLHASGVRVRESAVIFLGSSGAGKSTVAAAFAAQGHQVGTDDIAAIRRHDSGYELLPSFPRIRLHAPTAPLLGHTGESWPLPLDTRGKRSYQLSEDFSDRFLPLQRIYLLAEGSPIRVETVETSGILQGLIWQSFIRPLKMSAAMRLQHFQQCLDLAGRVPVRRLVCPRRLADLPALVRSVESDLAIKH
jgi:hypothetical protein